MLARETRPLMPPGFQKPRRPSTHTPPWGSRRRRINWLSQAAGRARFSRSSCRPPKKHEAFEKCKIANSLDDVFIAERGRVVKQFRGSMYPVHSRALSGRCHYSWPKTILRRTTAPQSRQHPPPQAPSFPVLGAAISASQAR